MNISLRDVVAAISSGHAALVAEVAGYWVLLASDAACQQPQLADADTLTLDSEGNVQLRGRPVSAEESERSLRQLLAGLTGQLRSPAPNLQRVAERPDLRGLATLVIELEAALVPVNRRAAKRSLARLFRETARAPRSGSAVLVEARPVPATPLAVAPVPAAPLAVAPAPVAVAPAPVAVAVAPAPAAVVTVAAPVASPLPPQSVSPLPPRSASPLAPPTRAVSPTPPPTRASSVPPPLPTQSKRIALPVPQAGVVRAPRPPLTLTPPPPPSVLSFGSHGLEAQRVSEPPLSLAVASAMLAAAGGSPSPVPPSAVEAAPLDSRPDDGVWVEEEDVLTELWAGTQLLGARDRTVIDAVTVESVEVEAAHIDCQGDETASPFEEVVVTDEPERAAWMPEAPPQAVEVTREPAVELRAAFAEHLEEEPNRFFSPLPSEARTPIRISTFPLALVPEPESVDGPLLDTGEAEPRRPSDVSELLSQMSVVPTPRGELYRGLLGISRVDLSPELPPLGLTASGD